MLIFLFLSCVNTQSKKSVYTFFTQEQDSLLLNAVTKGYQGLTFKNYYIDNQKAAFKEIYANPPDFVLGGLNSEETFNMALVLRNLNVPQCSGSATFVSEEWETGTPNDLFFRTIPTNNQSAVALVRFLEHLKVLNPTILVETSNYASDYLKHLRKASPKNFILTVRQLYKFNNQTDMEHNYRAIAILAKSM